MFLSVYVQVFFLITFLENRKKIIRRHGPLALSRYPEVTIIVPSYNEERTIYKTIRSLLALNYPKDKLKIFLIDDGSTDGTWNVISKFKKNKSIKIFRKENGGKHSALNLGLANTETKFVGCLDADSFVHPEALSRIMSYFEDNPDTMAVVPSVSVHQPRGIIQHAQKIEYNMGIYHKKMLSFLGAIDVTPGPFTIFRKKVFEDLGPYKKAHNTEDMEIAYRMQKHHYKIEHCNDAYVYTNTPHTVPKLYRQRLRWIYGFINNTVDYKDLILNFRYGNFSIFALTARSVSLVSIGYVFGKMIYEGLKYVWQHISFLSTAGVATPFKFDPFFINFKVSLLIVIVAYVIAILSVILGGQMATGKWKFPFEFLFYFMVFVVLAPFWTIKAFLNTFLARTPSWR